MRTVVSFAPYSCEIPYGYAVIFARYHNQWVFCQHKDRVTYECPGGHHEPGESIYETARRELYEETGALKYELVEISGYSVRTGSEETYGMLYFARITELGELPELEIARIELFTELPENWTYPEIQPLLVHKILESGLIECE